jgi:hypothetical protein
MAEKNQGFLFLLLQMSPLSLDELFLFERYCPQGARRGKRVVYTTVFLHSGIANTL